MKRRILRKKNIRYGIGLEVAIYSLDAAKVNSQGHQLSSEAIKDNTEIQLIEKARAYSETQTPELQKNALKNFLEYIVDKNIEVKDKSMQKIIDDIK